MRMMRDEDDEGGGEGSDEEFACGSDNDKEDHRLSP
jgi:hypothetical protein